MSDKRRYNIVLSDASMQEHVLAEDCCDMEVCDTLDNLDGVVSLMLTDEEAEHLNSDSCPHITAVELELQVIEHAFTPRSMTKEMRTKYTPSTSTAGANYAPTSFHFHSDQTVTANTGPVGYFDNLSEDPTITGQVISQNYAGQYVDIVAIEAGTPEADNDGYETHPDWLDDDGNTRFVKMDWDDYNNSISSTRNIQSSNNTEYFSDHAIGVLSVAAGLVCGFAKVSSMRVIYLSDGVATAYDAVLSWHNSKPVNPATGRRNATITTGAWGYSGIEHTTAWPCESISSLTWYDDEGNEQVTQRPAATSPTTLSVTASATGSGAYQVSGTDRDGSVSGDNPSINVYVGDTIAMTNNANGGHPMYFKTSQTTGTGDQVTGASGQGTANISWTPNTAGTYYYICEFHGAMVGQIVVSAAPSGGWGNDLTTFVNAGFLPRVIENPHTSTDEWMITSNVQNRATSLDTALANYVSNGSIYHFKSAGNNGTVAAHPDHPRWNTRFTTGPNDDGTGDHDYVYIYTNPTTGRYEFTATSRSAGTVWYPYRCYGEGGPNMITIGALQQSTVNAVGDDYSNRGPVVDAWAVGAFTWSSRPTSTYTDGKWGYFSGTSCAAPVAAGAAAVMVDWFFDTYGEYPTHAQLKDMIVRNAKPEVQSENYFDWSNVPTAGDFTSAKLYSSTELNRIKENDFQNGGSDISDLPKSTTNRRIHIPDYIIRNTKNYASSLTKQNKHYVSSDANRQSYPRRKIRVG